jgi:predicted nuclease of restriction endonuclease-like RecB superfamily
VELKLAKFLQLIGTIKRTIFRKVRKETILKLYNISVLPTFLYGSENWTLTASQGGGRNEVIETSGRLHPL